MHITRCSASAIKTYNHCAFKYYMHYILQMEDKAGKAALQGKIVHQVFEWMSKLKRRDKTYIDYMWLLERAWNMHVKQNPDISIRRVTSRGEAADFRKCRLSVETIIVNKYYNPYELDVIDGEIEFQLEMPGPEWECNNQQFRARGFIDLIHKINDETIEIIDWKTGSRADFFTKEDTNVYTLIKNIQARLYHLAATQFYPQYENILTTFYFTSDGGPITISLNRDDIPLTIAMLLEFFQKVKTDSVITRNRKWHCRMCSYERSGICNHAWADFNIRGEKYTKKKYHQLSFDKQKEISNV